MIDPTLDNVVATIPITGSGPSATPIGVGVNPTNGLVYVTDFGSQGYYTSGNSVSVIDPTTNTVTDTIGVGLQPLTTFVDAASGNAYVVNSSSDTVSVIHL